MLALSAVATTDGPTSLHSPLFTVGFTVLALAKVVDEHVHSARAIANPAIAIGMGLSIRRRTAGRLHTRATKPVSSASDSTSGLNPDPSLRLWARDVGVPFVGVE
jgi:hypothetical protein